MKKFLLGFSIFIVILVAVAAWAYQKINAFVELPVQTQPDQLLVLKRGTTGNQLVALFEQEKLVDNAELLPWLLKLRPDLNKVKAGTYALNGVKTVGDILQLLNSGKEVQFNVQFIEGETFKAWRKKLEKAPHLKQTLVGKSDAEIFDMLQLPDFAKAIHEQKKIEGWLYPDTYSYTPNSTDLDLLKRAAKRMEKALQQAWEQRDPNLPLNNPYELLILASIVEKETAVAAERGKVASVFINRLNKNMPLQTDPTIIYGMGEAYNGNIRRKDLETPGPYNTYLNLGLPPTPIAMPAESALQATANPEKTDYFYFVADGSGGHKFSRTLTEHNRAVQEYLRWYRNRQKGK
ncbi:cell division protein YceG [Actinobacillus seminis]|uniref:Endolytic murein transglycosylase n=1 Tax=Actinobacillus seminis TaxID=722 RepID=A0A263HEA9_9PAST|nr:endolytic transglycosylase MltG [Actinobacillus seminis]OZN25451.1 cell division protein YceG [Actinobacillus seminis]SUU38036.1 aminodeoxychorismate lyase [Actinobacillus seminis]